MQNKITICKCGFVETNHMFRHDFEAVADVEIKNENDKFVFAFDSSKFPVNTKTICSFPGCSGSKKMHSWNTQHNFDPKEISFKEIRLCVPSDVLQQFEKECIKKIQEKNIRTDSKYEDVNYANYFTSESCFGFKAFLNIRNLQQQDKIYVFNEDDDEIKYELVTSISS